MKTNRVKSLLLALFLFCFSLAIPLITADVVFSQVSGMELATEARSLYNNREYRDAVDLWQKAANTFEQQQDSLNQAMALSNLSLTYQKLGEWQLGKESIESSLAILDRQGETPELLTVLASTLEIQGKLLLTVGEAASALDSWQAATEIYTKIEEERGIIRSQINQAQIMQDLGLYPKACKIITKALALNVRDCEITEVALQELTASENLSLQIKGLVSLGNILRMMGENERSRNVLLTAEKLGNSQNLNLASVYLALGNTSLALAQENTYFARGTNIGSTESKNYEAAVANYLKDAENYYSQTIALATNPITIIQGKANLLNLFIQNKRGNPKGLISEIDTQLANLPTTPEKILTQINFARSLLKLKQEGLATPNIAEITKNAISQADSLGSARIQAFALATLGQYYELEKQWKLAENTTKQALNYTLGYNDRDIASEVFWQLGRIEQAQNKRQAAIDAYTRAYELLQSLRNDLIATSPDTQFSFRDRLEPVYRQLVELLLSPEIEPTQAELAQARQVIESLQLAELDNFFNEACIRANPVQIDKIAPNTAVIYSIILKDRLEVIISLPNGKLLHKSTTTGDRIEQVIAELRDTIALDHLFANRASISAIARSRDDNPSRGIQIIRKNNNGSNFQSPARQLYNWLIAPFTQELELNQVDTLVFVLDGVLRNIPMAVLQDGNQYLIEKYAVVLTPGMQLLDPQPLLRTKITTLTAGISQQSPNFPDFPPLPNVRQELESIGEKIATKILLNNAFTEQNLETKIDNAPFPIVHIATHGNFSSIAEETYILAWDERINATKINQVLQGKARSDSPIELLVLSACQTALGDERAVLGLAGVAMRGGAKSTLASLWLVNDEATALLMEKFYQELAQGKVSKAEALRRAQVAILKSEKFNDPYFWSAFVLVGNWL